MSSTSGASSPRSQQPIQGGGQQSQTRVSWRACTDLNLNGLLAGCTAEFQQLVRACAPTRTLSPETLGALIGGCMRNGAQALLTSILAHEDSSVLCIQGEISAAGLEVLGKALPEYPDTATLKLFEVSVDYGALPQFFGIMDRMYHLTRVVLNKPDELTTPFEALPQCARPRHLQSLEINGRSKVDTRLVLGIIDRSTLHGFVMRQPRRVEGHERIVAALREQASLASVELWFAQPAHLDGYMALPATCRSLTAVRLKHCVISPATIRQMLNSDSVRIRQLVLDSCKPVRDGVGPFDLAKLLDLPELRTLCLTRSRFHLEELAPVIDALAHNGGLQRLELTESSYDNALLGPLGKALKVNRTLTELSYFGLKIEDAALIPMVEALEINRSLSVLGLTSVEGPNMQRLQLLVKRNLTLAQSAYERIQHNAHLVMKEWFPPDIINLLANELYKDVDRERTAARLSRVNAAAYNQSAVLRGRLDLVLPRKEE